jgi:hypothetical protein
VPSEIPHMFAQLSSAVRIPEPAFRFAGDIALGSGRQACCAQECADSIYYAQYQYLR